MILEFIGTHVGAMFVGAVVWDIVREKIADRRAAKAHKLGLPDRTWRYR